MGVLSLLAGIAYIFLLLYLLVLIVRLILEYIPLFNRSWRPRGAGLVAAEVVYTLTDPPIRLLRRYVHPLRIGPVAIDFAFTLVLLACLILMSVTRSLSAL